MKGEKVESENSKKRFRLTPTDTQVLTMIAKDGMRTYQELRRMLLKDVSREHSWRILKKLVREGFLAECRGDENRLLGWRIDSNRQNGRRVLEAIPKATRLRGVIYRTSFDHDKYVREIKDLLSISPAIKSWSPEHEVRNAVMREYQSLSQEDKREKIGSVPDAVLTLKVNGKEMRAALELEMTRKSRQRIFDKLEKFVTTPDYKIALYVVRSEELMTFLKRTYQEVLQKSWRVKIAKVKNAIYFAKLEEVLRDGTKAKFYGPTNSFSFAEIS